MARPSRGRSCGRRGNGLEFGGMSSKTAWKSGNPLNPCACGCGTLVQGKWKRGHVRKGAKNTPEHNAKIAAGHLWKPMHPGTKAALLKALRGSHWTAERSESHSKKMLAHWSKNVHPLKGKAMPAEAARKSAASRKGLKRSKEAIERSRQGLKFRWDNDPEYREMMVKAITDCRQDMSPSWRAHIGDSKRGMRHSQKTRELLSEARRQMWKDPVYRKKMVDLCNTPWGKDRSRRGAAAALESFHVKGGKYSKPELHLKGLLEELGIPFEHQHFIRDIEKKYRCDFFLPSKRLVIESDGYFHHDFPTGRPLDWTRDEQLQAAGYSILRFWSYDVTLDTLRKAVEDIPDIPAVAV